MSKFAALERLIERVEQVAASGYDDAKAKAEESIQAVVDAQYERGAGPSGEPWAPLKSGGPSHLTKTRAMRSESKAVRGVKGVTVTIPKPGGFHQSGTSRMPARPLVPESDSALPQSWDAAVKGAFDAAVTKPLGG